MNSNQVRDYFKNNGLSYQQIDESDIYMLIALLAKDLKQFVFSPHVFDDKGNLSINKQTLKINIKNDVLEQAYIEVKGPYFDNREAISFNTDGFIGFAGWASDENKQVFIDSFKNWVDYLTQKETD